MRQIGDDLRQDPREPQVIVEAAQPDMSDPVNQAVLTQFMRNKFAEMSHKYCSVGLNLGMAKYTEAEQQRFETCLSKYGQAFNIYKEEQNVYFNTINEIKSQQGDIYAKFNEYDKY